VTSGLPSMPPAQRARSRTMVSLGKSLRSSQRPPSRRSTKTSDMGLQCMVVIRWCQESRRWCGWCCRRGCCCYQDGVLQHHVEYRGLAPPPRPVRPTFTAFTPIVCSTHVYEGCKVWQKMAEGVYNLAAKRGVFAGFDGHQIRLHGLAACRTRSHQHPRGMRAAA
jgi:hypothetical protein